MQQIIHCECGESEIRLGRCIGCKRVIPSSQEVLEQYVKVKELSIEILKDLQLALKLEKEDRNETISNSTTNS